jgi:hypothetical protein
MKGKDTGIYREPVCHGAGALSILLKLPDKFLKLLREVKQLAQRQTAGS